MQLSSLIECKKPHCVGVCRVEHGSTLPGIHAGRASAEWHQAAFRRPDDTRRCAIRRRSRTGSAAESARPATRAESSSWQVSLHGRWITGRGGGRPGGAEAGEERADQQGDEQPQRGVGGRLPRIVGSLLGGVLGLLQRCTHARLHIGHRACASAGLIPVSRAISCDRYWVSAGSRPSPCRLLTMMRFTSARTSRRSPIGPLPGNGRGGGRCARRVDRRPVPAAARHSGPSARPAAALQDRPALRGSCCGTANPPNSRGHLPVRPSQRRWHRLQPRRPWTQRHRRWRRPPCPHPARHRWPTSAGPRSAAWPPPTTRSRARCRGSRFRRRGSASTWYAGDPPDTPAGGGQCSEGEPGDAGPAEGFLADAFERPGRHRRQPQAHARINRMRESAAAAAAQRRLPHDTALSLAGGTMGAATTVVTSGPSGPRSGGSNRVLMQWMLRIRGCGCSGRPEAARALVKLARPLNHALLSQWRACQPGWHPPARRQKRPQMRGASHNLRGAISPGSRARRCRCRPGADGRSSFPDQPAVPANATPSRRYGPGRT